MHGFMALTFLALLAGCCWCNGVWNASLAHTAIANTRQMLIECLSLSEYCCWLCASLNGHNLTSSQRYVQVDNALSQRQSHLCFHEHKSDVSGIHGPSWETELCPANVFGMWQNGRSAWMYRMCTMLMPRITSDVTCQCRNWSKGVQRDKLKGDVAKN